MTLRTRSPQYRYTTSTTSLIVHHPRYRPAETRSCEPNDQTQPTAKPTHPLIGRAPTLPSPSNAPFSSPLPLPLANPCACPTAACPTTGLVTGVPCALPGLLGVGVPPPPPCVRKRAESADTCCGCGCGCGCWVVMAGRVRALFILQVDAGKDGHLSANGSKRGGHDAGGRFPGALESRESDRSAAALQGGILDSRTGVGLVSSTSFRPHTCTDE